MIPSGRTGKGRLMPDTPPPILKLRRVQPAFAPQPLMDQVHRMTGKSRLRQAGELLWLYLGPRRIPMSDYFLEGLWRPELTAADRATYVSDASSTAINRRLSPVDPIGLHGLLADKVLTKLALGAAGFPVQRTSALFGSVIALPGIPRLQSAADIAAFLRQDGTLPVFGKPLRGSLSIGAASIIALQEGDRVLLGNGRTVALAALATEIAQNFQSGYLFEPLIRQHPAVEAVTGPAVGALRVVTLRVPGGAEVLYTAQRLPAVGAMIDAASGSNPYTTALIDAATGRVLRAQKMDEMPPDSLDTSLVTGVRFDSVTLPFMPEALAIAVEVHRLMPQQGVLGFDFALTPTGPVINEVNSNPFHTIYQRAADRGFLNRDFKPRVDAAIALIRAERRIR